MFDPTSRYASIEKGSIDLPQRDGSTRTVRFVRRRFLPSPATLTPLVDHTMASGERLDIVAARYAGDPTAFWRLCDANDVLRPDELEIVGRVVVVAMARP
jgi:hypothetical protein